MRFLSLKNPPVGPPLGCVASHTMVSAPSSGTTYHEPPNSLYLSPLRRPSHLPRFLLHTARPHTRHGIGLLPRWTKVPFSASLSLSMSKVASTTAASHRPQPQHLTRQWTHGRLDLRVISHVTLIGARSPLLGISWLKDHCFSL
jgi:hypothetical protein